MPKTIKKILILEFSRIGDTLMHEPVLREIKLMYPGAEFHALTDQANFDLLKYHPAISQAEVFNRKIKTFKDVLRFVRLIKKIRSNNYELLINFYLGGSSINITRLSGIPQRLGFAKTPALRRVNNLRAKSMSGYSNWLVEFTELVRPLGGVPENIWPCPRVYIAEEFTQAVQEFLMLNKNYAAYNLATSDPIKCWPVASYVALAKMLYEEQNLLPVIISNPGQTDLVEQFQALYPKELPLIILPVMRLAKLAAVLTAMKILITGDTGVMHIGFGLELPTLAIFTYNRPEHVVAATPYKKVVFVEDPTAPKYPSGQCHGQKDLSVVLVKSGADELLKIS